MALSAQKVRLVDVDAASFDGLPCCGIKDPAHPGREAKRRWLEANAKSGLRAKTLLAPDGKPAGYIEYIPGESAWRGVNAAGYMFIHCVWVHNRRYQRKGWGRLLVESCIEDAQQAGAHGVAVMTRTGPWMADRRLFLSSGFKSVDTAPPDYDLLVHKFQRSAPNPAFREDWDRKVGRYDRGLTIIRSGQCPYVAKFEAEIVECAEKEFGIRPNLVNLRSASEAQDAPTPYAVFAVIRDGKVLADHQISRTRFRNMMKKFAKPVPAGITRSGKRAAR